MNYSEGVSKMLKLSDERRSFPLYSRSFSPYKGIMIEYPGKKLNGDYRLTVEGRSVPTHPTICKMLYDLIKNNLFTFRELKDFLSDIYRNGTNTTYTNLILEDLKHLIFWITLQEEINYPRKYGNAGINLAFCRFFEAIHSTEPSSDFSIRTVQYRCNNHGNLKPNLYSIESSPDFYHY